MQGRYVPSLLAALGDIIERHMIDIGFLAPTQAGAPPQIAARAERMVVGLDGPRLRQCPKCGEAALTRQENCDICTACDYSKCG
jgi:ribonucleoside-diphosphate reductase alpha chain